jgi:hypothetical protein
VLQAQMCLAEVLSAEEIVGRLAVIGRCQIHSGELVVRAKPVFVLYSVERSFLDFALESFEYISRADNEKLRVESLRLVNTVTRRDFSLLGESFFSD